MSSQDVTGELGTLLTALGGMWCAAVRLGCSGRLIVCSNSLTSDHLHQCDMESLLGRFDVDGEPKDLHVWVVKTGALEVGPEGHEHMTCKGRSDLKSKICILHYSIAPNHNSTTIVTVFLFPQIQALMDTFACYLQNCILKFWLSLSSLQPL